MLELSGHCGLSERGWSVKQSVRVDVLFWPEGILLGLGAEMSIVQLLFASCCFRCLLA